MLTSAFNLLVVPENKRKIIVFSFRPIDSVVFLNIKYVLFLYLLIPFLWMLVQWTTEMHLFHISKNDFWVKVHFNLRNPWFRGDKGFLYSYRFMKPWEQVHIQSQVFICSSLSLAANESRLLRSAASRTGSLKLRD